MKSRTLIALTIIVTLSLGLAVGSYAISKFEYVYPLIKDYGPVHPLPDAAVQPDKALKYKVIFDVTVSSKKAGKVNGGLNHVARFMNLMYSSGIEPGKMDIAVIIHGPATPIVLKKDFFKEKHGIDNPDLKIIQDLKKTGVKLYVCGQALADNKFEHSWVNENITIVLSALVFVPTYELEGYAYVPFH